MWYFLAAMMAIMAFLIWDYRRKKGSREAASQERFDQIFKTGTSSPAAAAPGAQVTPVAPVPAAQAPASDAEPEAAPPIAYSARPHVLGPAEKLAYFLLRTGLPDLEVFPKVSLAAVIDIPVKGYDREQQLRRLARQVLDFVICDKQMKVLAVVQFAPVGPEAVIAQRIRSDCLKAAGIRLVTIVPAALPKRAEVRAFIFEGAAPSGAVPAASRTV